MPWQNISTPRRNEGVKFLLTCLLPLSTFPPEIHLTQNYDFLLVNIKTLIFSPAEQCTPPSPTELQTELSIPVLSFFASASAPLCSSKSRSASRAPSLQRNFFLEIVNITRIIFFIPHLRTKSTTNDFDKIKIIIAI